MNTKKITPFQQFAADFRTDLIRNNIKHRTQDINGIEINYVMPTTMSNPLNKRLNKKVIREALGRIKPRNQATHPH
jgi:hypothetical protein